MAEQDDLKRWFIEIAAALSMSEDALLAMATIDKGEQALPEADVLEIAENFLAITDPHARKMLLRLSRTLMGRETG